MTRQFNIQHTCENCGHRQSAETGFGRWMRNHPKLESRAGIVRTDTDHTILRYLTHPQGREFQLMMDVEVKENGAEPRDDQRDIQAFKTQLALERGENMHGAKTIVTRRLYSVLNHRRVRLRYFGYHLLQFEKTSPLDSTWIKWNRQPITEEQLTDLLAFELNPFDPSRPMMELLRDRHGTATHDSDQNLFLLELLKEATE